MSAGTPGPVVADGDGRPVRQVDHAHVDPAARLGVAHGIVDQGSRAAPGSLQHGRPRSPCSAGDAEVDRPTVRKRYQAGDGLSHQVVKSNRSSSAGTLGGIVARDPQQLVGECRSPLRAGLKILQALGERGVRRRASKVADLQCQRGERRPQFVRRVREEPADEASPSEGVPAARSSRPPPAGPRSARARSGSASCQRRSRRRCHRPPGQAGRDSRHSNPRSSQDSGMATRSGSAARNEASAASSRRTAICCAI